MFDPAAYRRANRGLGLSQTCPADSLLVSLVDAGMSPPLSGHEELIGKPKQEGEGSAPSPIGQVLQGVFNGHCFPTSTYRHRYQHARYSPFQAAFIRQLFPSLFYI